MGNEEGMKGRRKRGGGGAWGGREMKERTTRHEGAC